MLTNRTMENTLIFPIEIDGHIYDVLSEADISFAAQVVAHAFAHKEPLSLFLNIPERALFKLCQTFITQTMKDQLSMVCKNKAGHVVGAILCRDFTTTFDLTGVDVVFDPIFSLLDQLMSKHFSLKQQSFWHPHQVVEMFMIGTDLTMIGSAIGRNLMRISSLLFRQRGYQLSITEATSPISQSISVQLGLQDLVLLDYSDFEFNGEKIFENISFDHYRTSAKLFTKGKAGAVLFIDDMTTR